ncbi:hypothetical protein M427DRAFT_62641 [Gonapodya prolifera JEL478]|uniref:Uncharacterized protein n=1 Tax=Gonapodya prolifera (strain JEL478) TaxID=1344416 RepID=A0A139A136_GONPJ|nr:hypothetical protein M427DRAFT_62641 [Gonapodya prolifera JEL478]|eukprot:KXS10235.1 hypothetical protein M427DRAFT_62641 [Gonapodya prolifera JEL478]
MSSATPLATLYDISTRPPASKTCCSPNPTKARLALNFKDIPHVTRWVQMPDIPTVRRGLGLEACRKFADGTDFYTLPIVTDPSTGAVVGDSFDIAAYLQSTYPNAGAGDLFPEQDLSYEFPENLPLLVPLSDHTGKPHPSYALFAAKVDATFTAHTQLTVGGFPFDPASEAASRVEFARRAMVPQLEVLTLTGDSRERAMKTFEDTLGVLAAMLKRDPSGPFLLGKRASYADLVIVGWLRMFWGTLRKEEWERLCKWHDGGFGRLYEAVDEAWGAVREEVVVV